MSLAIIYHFKYKVTRYYNHKKAALAQGRQLKEAAAKLEIPFIQPQRIINIIGIARSMAIHLFLFYQMYVGLRKWLSHGNRTKIDKK